MRKLSVFQGLGAAGFVGLTALVMACSGTSTGTGTSSSSSSGGGSKGIFGGGGGGSSNGGTSGATSSSGGSCSTTAEDNTCTTCLKTTCCTTYQGCANNAECVAIANCFDGCGDNDDACLNTCVTSHPGGQNAIKAFVDCGNQSCQTQCTTSSSGSSSSGSSGAAGTGFGACLSDVPQDPSYCSNNTSLIIVDCPNGNPSPTKCTASPTGSPGIYCCTSVN